MRPELLLVVALVAGAGAMAGCIEGGEELDPASTSEVSPASDEGEDASSTEEQAGEDDEDETSESSSDETDGNATSSSDGDANETTSVSPSDTGEDLSRPMAVVAHIDTGINPYHEVFRDDSELADTHPSEYIDGYPEDAQALNLTLDADSWEEAFEADREIWENVTRDELYWIPGTRIDAARSAGAGGTYCPGTVQAPPVALAENIADGVVEEQTGEDLKEDCEDWPILDDHGHGTMTASRMAGEGTSLCPDCRIVSIEGLGSSQTLWAAEQGWIDAQTNSWGSFYPDPASAALDEATGGSFGENIETAAQTHLTYFSSGNGFAGFFGFTPWPTHLQATHQEGVVSVGAHDNGRVSHWQGTPPHIVADGYRGLTASPDELTGVRASPFACCTSAASPYAAGLGARIVQEARTILEDTSAGVDEGVVAEGSSTAVVDGPLDDGQLTLDELRTFVKHTAEPRPSEGRHDGDTHWMGEASSDEATGESDPWGPGGNPYCPGCVTSPAEWTELPQQAPAYPIVGYGGATPAALEDARTVLNGLASEPDRSEVDEYFEAQRPVHEAMHDPAP